MGLGAWQAAADRAAAAEKLSAERTLAVGIRLEQVKVRLHMNSNMKPKEGHES